MSNKSNGTEFEKEFAQLLFENGFWVHLMQDNRNGQPFDVIAAKDGKTYVFDCKDCQTGIFQLSRIEENQWSAMKLWAETGNIPGLFALNVQGLIYVVPWRVLEILKESGNKSISRREIAKFGRRIESWFDSVERQGTR